MQLGRRTNRARILPLAMACVLGVATGAVRAQEWDHHHQGPPGRPGEAMLERLLDRLDLSDDQKAALQKPLDDHRAAMKANFQRLFEARRALEDKIRAEAYDEGAIREAAQAVAAVEADQAVVRARMMRDIRKVLTPDQRKKLSAMQEMRRERMEEHFHGAPGSPQAPGDEE